MTVGVRRVRLTRPVISQFAFVNAHEQTEQTNSSPLIWAAVTDTDMGTEMGTDMAVQCLRAYTAGMASV